MASREHDDPVAAMKDLNAAIDRDEGYGGPGVGTQYMIEVPDGCELPLNDMYYRTYGAYPEFCSRGHIYNWKRKPLDGVRLESWMCDRV